MPARLSSSLTASRIHAKLADMMKPHAEADRQLLMALVRFPSVDGELHALASQRLSTREMLRARVKHQHLKHMLEGLCTCCQVEKRYAAEPSCLCVKDVRMECCSRCPACCPCEA